MSMPPRGISVCPLPNFPARSVAVFSALCDLRFDSLLAKKPLTAGIAKDFCQGRGERQALEYLEAAFTGAHSHIAGAASLPRFPA